MSPSQTAAAESSPAAGPASRGSTGMRLTELADYVVPFTLRAVCELKIADLLAGGPRPVAELARQTGTHQLALYRALRALACRGVFTEVSPEVFGLTPLAQRLRSDHPDSLRDAYPLLPADITAWAAIEHSLRTGQSAFQHAHGQDYWAYLAGHPDAAARFHASQQSVTRRELQVLLGAYDWATFGTIVDVGGGNGAFLAGLLAAFPSARGILFDQPAAVAGAGRVLAGQGVADRCEVVAGSFLTAVPAGGDAYLLKRVLYDRDDDEAVSVLRTVRAAMGSNSRLLLIEPVLEPGDSFDPGRLYDVLLLVMAGGGSRTLKRLRELFAAADLELTRTLPTRMLPIVEARPS